jgi:hypothetical protein
VANSSSQVSPLGNLDLKPTPLRQATQSFLTGKVSLLPKLVGNFSCPLGIVLLLSRSSRFKGKMLTLQVFNATLALPTISNSPLIHFSYHFKRKLSILKMVVGNSSGNFADNFCLSLVGIHLPDRPFPITATVSFSERQQSSIRKVVYSAQKAELRQLPDSRPRRSAYAVLFTSASSLCQPSVKEYLTLLSPVRILLIFGK